MAKQPQTHEEHMDLLVKELRAVGVRGKIEFGTYHAPKTIDADRLEQAMVAAGWKCMKSGMYYTEWTPVDKINDHLGIFHKGNIEARVRWGNTTSTNPPSVSLALVPEPKV